MLTGKSILAGAIQFSLFQFLIYLQGQKNKLNIMKTQEIVFEQVKHRLSMTCRVETEIHANAENIWNLLTDAKRFSSWNSTVSSIEGNIRDGERIQIHVPGTHRTFKPKVSGVVANKFMTWSNG